MTLRLDASNREGVASVHALMCGSGIDVRIRRFATALDLCGVVSSDVLRWLRYAASLCNEARMARGPKSELSVSFITFMSDARNFMTPALVRCSQPLRQQWAVINDEVFTLQMEYLIEREVLIENMIAA